jgi:hypothetical protein
MASNDKSPGENGERERIGRYELLTECAPGAIGGLWAARIVSGANEGKIVSLRRIAPRAGIDARLVQEACEAAWAAMELRIKGVLPVIDVVVADGRVGVIRDYVEGDTLHTVLREAAKKNEKVPAPVAQRIALEAVTALAAMDAAGREQPEMAEFLFGGMWSDRVLVHSDGQVSLCDLELMGKGAAAASRSRDNDMLAFRAPEHLQMGGQFDARTDVFLMGVVLWELFAGRRLFSGQCDPALSEAIHGSPIPRLDSPELKLSDARGPAEIRRCGRNACRGRGLRRQGHERAVGKMPRLHRVGVGRQGGCLGHRDPCTQGQDRSRGTAHASSRQGHSAPELGRLAVGQDRRQACCPEPHAGSRSRGPGRPGQG